MEKNKSNDEWVNLVETLTTRKRREKQYKIPGSYIMSIADRIHKTNPTREMIFSTLSDFYKIAFEDGWLSKTAQGRQFKEKKEKHIDEDFKKFQDEIDDLIHNK